MFRKAHGVLPLATPAQPSPEAARAPLVLRRTWARLIRQVYEGDPLRCTRCGATLQVIAVIEDEEVIYRILSHLKLLSPGDGPRAPPRAESGKGPSRSVFSASPASAGPGELTYEACYDDPPWPDPA